MAPSLSRLSSTARIGVWLLLISCLSFIHTTLAASPKYIQATAESGQTVFLLDDRKPALYTQNFGDCLGDSLINVTRFDAAYYKDNMTVLFHLEGNTAVANESLMRRSMPKPRASSQLMFPVYIGVYAYGEARFDLTFNPCNAQIYR